MTKKKSEEADKIAIDEVDLLAIEDDVAETRQLAAIAWLAAQGIASGAHSKDGIAGLQFLLAQVQDRLRAIGDGVATARGFDHEAADTRIAARRNAIAKRRKER